VTLRCDLRNGAVRQAVNFDSLRAARAIAHLAFRRLGMSPRRLMAALARPIPVFRRKMQAVR